MAFGDKEQYERWIKPTPVSNLYPSAYKFHLVKTLEELEEILNKNFNAIALDTETTGLNIDESFMVGYSFCYDGVNAYYVPVNHAPYMETNKIEITHEEYLNQQDNPDINLYDLEYNEEENKYYKIINLGEKNDSLGYKSVELFYNALLKCKYVFYFNARFDIRVFEKYGFYEEGESKFGPNFLENKDYWNDRYNKQFCHFDMSRLPLIDVQALVYLSDTNIPYPNLKGSEEYFLGWRGASFKDTLSEAENFYYLKPSEGYIYAATDALGTYLLAQKLRQFFLEPGEHTRYPNMLNSGQLDNYFLYPLMMMEDELVNIDTNLLHKYEEYYTEAIGKTQDTIDRIYGGHLNALSPKQKSEAFKKLGIITYEHDGTPALNKRGEYKADKEHLNMAIEKLPEDDNKRIFMESLLQMATLKKQMGTYTSNYIEMCEKSHFGNRLRFGYKTMVVPSGRLAAGGDKKNNYFADGNIQNIPKPKMTNVYYVKYEDLIKIVPDLEGKYENKYQEYEYNGEHTYKVLDWVFKETVWKLGIPEWKIEGFKQKLNLRSPFCSDEDKYWVSCDYSAQELRVPALLTGEPTWSKVFAENGDLHEHMAKVIWGEENYDKGKRKKAKRCNFGILYGMTPRNFSIDFEIPMEEAEDLVKSYKQGAPTLFAWVARNEDNARRTGITYTMFGRPRRLGWYLSPNRKRGMQSFGIRSCTNTVIQGTGADLLKMSFLKIFETFFKNSETRNKNRNYIKFLNTVHDEINYNVSREHVYTLVPMIIKCMRFWLPDWDFPMKVGLDIGTRWGQTITFKYDEEAYIELNEENINEYQGAKRYSLIDFDEAQRKNIHGLMRYYEDPNGKYVKNKNYLHIQEPDGEPVTEKDYEVKEEKKENNIELESTSDNDIDFNNAWNEELNNNYEEMAYGYSGFSNEAERNNQFNYRK